MSRCEDFPCCGHTDQDPCPQYTKSGRLRCTCGKPLPRGSRSSLCRRCLTRGMSDRELYEDATGQDFELAGEQ